MLLLMMNNLCYAVTKKSVTKKTGTSLMKKAELHVNVRKTYMSELYNYDICAVLLCGARTEVYIVCMFYLCALMPATPEVHKLVL